MAKRKKRASQGPNIYDVAEHAGVSHSTVARVIHGKQSPIVISEKTRERVLQSIRTLGYHPHVFRTKHTGIIGLTFSRHALHRVIADPFYSRVLAGVEEETATHDISLLVAGISEAEIQAGNLPRFITHRYIDGLLAIGTLCDHYDGLADFAGIPMVMLDHSVADDDKSYVVADNKEGMRCATEHLIEQGHRRIGYINTNSSNPNFEARLAGHIYALKKHAVQYEPKWTVTGDPLSDGGYIGMQQILTRSPHLTAVVCANDSLAIHALKYLQEKSVGVPSQFSVVGFDDIDLCQYMNPPLSTVHVDKQEMGRAAVRLLWNMMSPTTGDQDPGAKQVILPTEFVARGSSGRAPAEA